MKPAPKPWTDADRDLLSSLYPDMQNHVLAQLLGRTKPAIKQMAVKLGLHKTAEYHQQYTARFQPGHATWNKGKKGFHPGGRSAETRFKPGRHPSEAHHYLPIGTIRTRHDGYLERKWTDDTSLYPAKRWKLCHVELWEQHNGPVPEGHIVTFINGDNRDFRIENLECISRPDHMRRNSIHTLPPEIRGLCRLRGSLNKAINKRKSA